MKVKWRINRERIIIAIASLKDKVFYLFDKNNKVILKLEKAEVEFINKFGFMINGFQKYDSENEEYKYMRYYFEI